MDFLGAVLANEDAAVQAGFFKAMVKEMDGWGTTFSWTSATGVLRSCGSNRTCGDSDDITYSL
jgi:hypothetical protein